MAHDSSDFTVRRAYYLYRRAGSQSSPGVAETAGRTASDASMSGQYIVATHSAELIRWLKPEEILVMDKEEGRSNFTWADSLDLHEWLQEYTLDQLWLMGTLGGRP